MAIALSVALYAGISLTHASLLDRAAKALDDEDAATNATLGGVRIDAQGAAAMRMPEEMSEEMSDEERRRRG